MTERTTVSMPDEVKRYADNHGISLSELIQTEIEQRKRRHGDRRQQLKQELAEAEQELEKLEEATETKRAEVNEIKAELEDLEDSEDKFTGQFIKTCEGLLSSDEQERSAVIQAFDGDTEAVKKCFGECIDRRGLETTDEVVGMLEANGYTKESLNPLKVDGEENKMAEELVKNNLTVEEKQRVEEWVDENY